jgi:hypothetical protein
MKEILNEFHNFPIKCNGCIVASDHRAVKRGSTSGAASLFIYRGREDCNGKDSSGRNCAV